MAENLLEIFYTCCNHRTSFDQSLHSVGQERASPRDANEVQHIPHSQWPCSTRAAMGRSPQHPPCRWEPSPSHHPTCSASEVPSYQHSLHCHQKGCLVSCRAFPMSLLGNIKTVQGLLWTIQIWPLLLVSTSRSDGELCAQPETPAARRSKGKWNKWPKDMLPGEDACSPLADAETEQVRRLSTSLHKGIGGE